MKRGDFWVNKNTHEIWEFQDHWHFKGIHKLNSMLVDENDEMKYYLPRPCSEKCIAIEKKPE